MITDFVTGMFLGIALTLACAYFFFFYAKRKSWIDVKVAPEEPLSAADRGAIDQLYDRIDEANTRLKYLEDTLRPYLKKLE